MGNQYKQISDDGGVERTAGSLNANERSGEKGSRRLQSPKKAQPNRSKIRMTV